MIQFGDLKENNAGRKGGLPPKFFQFANRSINQTFEAEKKMKEDLSDVPFA